MSQNRNTSYKRKSSLFQQVVCAQKNLYKTCGFNQTDLVEQDESKEYYAHTFTVNEKTILFRIAKKTPTKHGYFVTIYKRGDDGIIAPYDEDDNFDFFVVTILDETIIGQFIFPKAVLIAKNIFSKQNREGKRAIRVYCPWDIVDNKQAATTQAWQSHYFVTIHPLESCNIELVKKLFRLAP